MRKKIPRYRQPAEWAKHKGVWTAWPYLKNEWPHIKQSQDEFIAFCELIAEFGSEMLNIAFPSEEIYQKVKHRFIGIEFVAHIMDYGDSWFRDTAPVWVIDVAGKITSMCFRFNGWGGKYIMPGDEKVALTIAKKVDYPIVCVPMIFEGGSMETDGTGTGITTVQCLLNKNRNPGIEKEEIKRVIMEVYGLDKLIWIDEGLDKDHTDGHVDNIARFFAPGKVLVMRPSGDDDPNTETYKRIIAQLTSETDADGKPLEVVTVPSPGKVVIDGDIMPASYMNFCITNGVVIVPIYDTPYDAEAVEIINACFPDRKVIGISSKYILTGGGSFHCITQQEPAFD